MDLMLLILLILLKFLGMTMAEKRFHLNIATLVSEPFMFDVLDLQNKPRKVGFVKDILDLLSTRMNFTYNLYLVPEGRYGAPDVNGVWNGIVGEVMYHRADMAVADLTVTAVRSKVISFAQPYMNLDLGFIYKKPTVKFSLFAFLMPFSTSVWFLIGGCLITTTLSLYLFGKTSCKDDPLKSLVACFYFGLACLFAQGPETYPRSLFSRAISTSWWFFTLMTLTLYTATLTSILTVNRSTLSIQSIEDLLNSETFQYAIEPGNSVQSLFEHSTYGPFQMMWNELTKRKKDSFLLEKDALKKVRNKDNFAFIGESPFLEYDVTFAPCNLELVVSRNSPKTGSGYAFAFAQNSTLVKIFSIETLKMLADGQMSAIHAKWFKTRSQCSDEKKLANIINTIDFDDIRGILFTFLAGVVVPFTLYGFKRIWDQTILNIRSRNAVRDENSLRTDYLETASQHACNASDNEILSGDQVEVSDSSAIGDQKTPSKSEQNDGDSSQCTSS